MKAIEILIFADLNSAAALEAIGFKVEVDDAYNKIISAEINANDVMDAIQLCEELHRINLIGSVSYNGEDYSSEEFFNKEFTDAELGLA